MVTRRPQVAEVRIKKSYEPRDFVSVPPSGAPPGSERSRVAAQTGGGRGGGTPGSVPKRRERIDENYEPGAPTYPTPKGGPPGTRRREPPAPERDPDRPVSPPQE